MQFFDNLKASYASLPGDTKRTLLILGGVGGGLVLLFVVLVIIFLTPTSRSITSTNASPEITSPPFASLEPTDIPFISKEDLDAIRPHFTPTPTHLPGEFYIPNGQQNDLEIRYAHFDEGDTFDEIRVKNKKTLEERPIGYMYRFAPGNSAFFSKDFSQIIYLGGTKTDYHKITFYSIPQNRDVAHITLDQMKQALPKLNANIAAVLSKLEVSPDKSKVALSYGTTFSTNSIAPDTQIIIIRLADKRMQLLPVKGLVKGWINDTTLQYEVNTTNPSANNAFEIPINGI